MRATASILGAEGPLRSKFDPEAALKNAGNREHFRRRRTFVEQNLIPNPSPHHFYLLAARGEGLLFNKGTNTFKHNKDNISASLIPSIYRINIRPPAPEPNIILP